MARDPSFPPPLSELGQSGIGVAAAPSGGMGLALDPNGKLPHGVLFVRGAEPTTARIDFGVAATTMSASANSAVKTVSHALGVVPTVVIATGNKDGVSTPVVQVGNLTATTFDILVHDADNIARTGDTVVYWLAIG